MNLPAAPREATRLGELSAYQWKSGIAAWLGWMFDGLELHLYTLVATPLVIHLLAAASAADPAVKEKSAYIQAAFLVGWATGGAFFGRLGDLVGRGRVRLVAARGRIGQPEGPFRPAAESLSPRRRSPPRGEAHWPPRRARTRCA